MFSTSLNKLVVYNFRRDDVTSTMVTAKLVPPSGQCVFRNEWSVASLFLSRRATVLTPQCILSACCECASTLLSVSFILFIWNYIIYFCIFISNDGISLWNILFILVNYESTWISTWLNDIELLDYVQTNVYRVSSKPKLKILNSNFVNFFYKYC